MVQRLLLWKLYHITQEINRSTREVEKASEQLHDLRNTVVSGYHLFNSDISRTRPMPRSRRPERSTRRCC